jgi:hypothetical protein
MVLFADFGKKEHVFQPVSQGRMILAEIALQRLSDPRPATLLTTRSAESSPN